jgi:hypothetical protein
MAFEPYEMKVGAQSPKAALANSSFDRIQFNRTASRLLPPNTHCHVWYDPDTERIALVPAEECAPGALRLSRSATGYASLCTIGVRKKFGIDFPKTYVLHVEPTGWIILTPVTDRHPTF